MTTVTEAEAKAQFSALLSSVQAGEDVLITRDGSPVARLVPVPARRTFGGLVFDVPDDFDRPLDEVEVAAWF